MRALLLATWGNCWLSQACSLDDAAQGASGNDLPHRVDGAPWGDDAALSVTFGRLAELGVRGLRLALPVPGDLSGLAGPPEFNLAAVTAGESVLLYGAGAGLIPQVSQQPAGRAPVRWVWYQAAVDRFDHLSGAEAARAVPRDDACRDRHTDQSRSGWDVSRDRSGSCRAAPRRSSAPPVAPHISVRRALPAGTSVVACGGSRPGQAGQWHCAVRQRARASC